MNSKGQSTMEFGIICILVAVVAIASVMLFGKNIKVFFDKNPAVAKAEQDPNIINKAMPDNNYVKPVVVNETEVYFNQDGSASFTVGGQDVNLSSGIIQSLDIVFETSGSQGMGLNSTVIDAIAKLVNDHKAEFGNADVPIEISFAESKRDQSGTTYAGNSTMNSVQLNVGNHHILINNDQYCDGPDCSGMSVQTIDGYEDPVTKQFTGTIYSEGTVLNGQAFTGSFENEKLLTGSTPSVNVWHFGFQDS